LRGGGGRDLPGRSRHRALPGLLRQPRRERQQVPRRRLPLGGPRPRRRARRVPLSLLRRPHRRLDPEGRRELLCAPGGSADPGASRRGARGGIRRAVRRVGRARHGRTEAARGGSLRRAWILRVLRAPGRRRRHGPQVVSRLRARRPRVRVHEDGKDPRAEPEAGALRPAPPPRRAPLLAAPRRHRLHALHRGRLRGTAGGVRPGGEARSPRPLSAFPKRPRMPRRAVAVLVLLAMPALAAEPAPCPAYLPRAELTGHVPAVLRELSGFAASRVHRGIFWAHNDSGNVLALYAMRADGSIAATFPLRGATARDPEDIAVGPCSAGADRSCIYLGDIGDNGARRTSVQILKVTEPE